MAETSTPFRKHARASIRLSRLRWNLAPRLIDTRRIRKFHSPEGSSPRKSKKSLPKLAKSKTQVLEGRFWRNAHWRKEQEALFKPCKQREPTSTVSWVSSCCATQLFLCHCILYVAMQAVLQREKARDVIVRGPYSRYMHTRLHTWTYIHNG